MTAPTLPPPPPPATEPPRPPRLPGLPAGAVVAGAAIVLVAVVAFASHGTPVWAPLRHGRADRGEMLVAVLLTVGAGVVAALAIVVVVHQLVVARRPGAPTLGTTLKRAAPLIVVGLGLLALAAIARTELDPERADPPRPPAGARGGGGEGTTFGSGRLGDFDRDGRPDIGLDLNGDGVVDHVARLEPGGRRGRLDDGQGTLDLGELAESGRLVGGVDRDGDGDIDQYVLFDVDGDGRFDLGPGYDGELDGQAGLVDRDGDGRIDGELDLDDDGRFETEPDLDGQDASAPPPEGGDEPEREQERERSGGPDLGALGPILLGLLIAVAVVLLGAGLWAYVSGRRRESAEDDAGEDDDAAREAMAASVADTIGAMMADPDPRTAIIGAYARLLEGLAASGVPRLDHEAPLEHLRRALAGLRVRPEPLRRLIELFEVARFSTHPLTEAHRTEALAALRAAAADLAASRPAEPAGAPR